MALSANTVWEVRTTGNDTNGGGFVTGASGTDWSQQDAAQYSVTDGVTAGSTTITSATANFGTDVVGNIIYVQGGTGSVVAGWYQIISRTNSTTIVVDRSTGLTAGTGVTLKIGGCFATIQTAATLNTVKGMTIWIKGTYTISTGITFPAGPSYDCKNFVNGYGTTRGDGVKAIIRATAGITIITINSGHHLRWLDIDGDNIASTKGISCTSSNYHAITECKVRNCTNRGIDGNSHAGGGLHILDTEVTGCTTTSPAIQLATGGSISGCYIHDNTVTGLDGSVPITVTRCIIANNTGASSDGIGNGIYGAVIENCVIYGNGRNGISLTQNYIDIICSIRNNIIYGNGAYGIRFASAPVNSPSIPEVNYNAFRNNTSGNFLHLVAGSNDVTLTADPFLNAAAGNFALNNVAGGGALCRASGYPGVFPGGLTTSYLDIGAVQTRSDTIIKWAGIRR